MKHAWTLAAVAVAVALTTAFVFAEQEQGSGVIFVHSRTVKYSPMMPGGLELRRLGRYRHDAGAKRVGPGDFIRIPGGHKHWSGGDKKEGALFYQETFGKFDLIPVK